MTDDAPSCRDCALAEWQRTPTGRVRKAFRGICRWDHEAFFARLSTEIPASVANGYGAVTAHHFRPNAIWWDNPNPGCPQHVKGD